MTKKLKNIKQYNEVVKLSLDLYRFKMAAAVM